MSRSPCCESRARNLVEELIEREGATPEAEGQRVLSGIGEKYPRLWRSALADTPVHVLELRPPAAAMRLSVSCSACGGEVTTIVVASQVLLTIQRLMLLFGETMIVVRDERHARLTVLEPKNEQVEEFRAILAAYVGGDGLGHPKGHEISKRWAALDSPIGRDLQRSAELGQLWFLAHEVGHGFTSESFRQRYGFADNREALKAELKQMTGDLGRRTLRLWAEEINADVFATYLLYESLMDRIRFSYPEAEARLRVSRDLAGGVAAACEGLFQLELVVLGPRTEREAEFTPSHPPAHIRWKILSKYISHLGDCGEEASDLFFLAQIIARASQGFIIKARPAYARGLPDSQ
jgi:hypothetical protein